jgi:hypothetical protein
MANPGDAALLTGGDFVSGPSDLLPTNTQVFSSTVRYGRPFWLLFLSAAIACPLFLIAGVASEGGAKAGLLGFAFGWP